MAYIVPRVQITQDFTSIPVFTEQPLAAFIIGPQYKLFRYSESSEKPFTAVVNPDDSALGNEYQYLVDTAYAYPNRPAGSTVDQSYIQVWMDNVEAQYFPNADLGAGSNAIAKVAVPVIGGYYSNRARSSTLIFKEGNGYSRSTDFSERDVQIGDVLEITDGSETLHTKVSGFHAEVVASSIGAASNDSGNIATVVMDVNDAPTPGGVYATVTIANTSTAYVGYPALRVMADTYTAEVTTAGNLTTARFKVTSANNVFAPVEDVALAAGDVLNLDVSTGQVVRFDYTGSTAFTVGMTWSVPVTAAVTQVTPTAAGTYVGTKDLTYSALVTRGGPFYDGSNAATCARIEITSTDTDSSGPVNVEAATAFSVGTVGVTFSFATGSTGSGSSLILGDVYHVTATAAADAQIRTLEFTDSLTAGLLAAGSLTFKLYLTRTSLEIPEIIDLALSQYAWVASAEEITVNADIFTTDPLLLTSLAKLPIKVGNIYVQHRDLVVDNSTSIGSITTTDEVATKLGTIHPDNPLAQGVYEAVLNSAGTVVYFVNVISDDLAGYNGALNLAKNTNSVYGLVPLTFDRTIQDAIVSHVNAMSTASNAKWRVCWLSFPLIETALIYNLKPDTSNWTATITDDPLTSGTQYKLVTAAGASFVTDGVRPGDKFFYNFRLNTKGETIYDEYTVNAVRTETTLTLTTGSTVVENTAKKMQIERVYTKDEQINNLALVGGEFNNRRVRAVFPDSVLSGGVTLDGYFVCAALAGLRSGVVPHQGLTNIEVLGFDDVSKSITGFTETQLNVLAAEGYWILTAKAVGATAYTRHQLTTDFSSLNTSEDSVTTNVDSISYGLQATLDPFIGVYNRNTDSLILIRNAIDNQLRFRQTATFTTTAGNQLNGYTIVGVTPNATFKDRLDVEISLQVPYPYNYINVTLTV